MWMQSFELWRKGLLGKMWVKGMNIGDNGGREDSGVVWQRYGGTGMSFYEVSTKWSRNWIPYIYVCIGET